jgi:hypothetical protein
MCRRQKIDETNFGADETRFAGDDNFLKRRLTNQAGTGSDKQIGPKRPK